MIDFSKALDQVNHSILYGKLAGLGLPDHVISWIHSFLTDHTQVVSYNGKVSLPVYINTGIVQGFGIGPRLYAVMESDLRTLSPMNIVVKYADDTNILVPSDSDTDLLEEFDHINLWADDNKMLINLLKTKKIVFRRPNPRLHISHLPITEVQQVSSAKLLGLTLCDTLSFTTHVENMLKICSQLVYLLKLLLGQGLTRHYLHVVFDALVLCKLRYAICAWSGFLSAVLEGQINAFLKCSFKYVFVLRYTQYRLLLKKQISFYLGK